MKIIEKTLDDQWWVDYQKQKCKRKLRCIALFILGLLFGLMPIILF